MTEVQQGQFAADRDDADARCRRHAAAELLMASPHRRHHNNTEDIYTGAIDLPSDR
jgi:hypothetical protein